MKADKVQIHEVGMRDGLQSIASIMPTADKCAWIDSAWQAGLRNIEVGSFVSPKLLPQLADTPELVAHASVLDGLQIAALVPNLKGAENAIAAGVHKLTVPVSMTEAHSQSNLRRCRAQVVADVGSIVSRCKQLPKTQRPLVEASLSMAFGCTQQGLVAQDEVMQISEQLLSLGVDQLRPADTVGYGNPAQLKQLLGAMRSAFGAARVSGVHLHNSRGQGLAMVVAALDIGIRSFDSSLGGLGGCPFAPGASGNIVTEDLVWMLDAMGFDTGINLDQLLAVRKRVEKQLPDERLYGFLAGAGRPRTTPEI